MSRRRSAPLSMCIVALAVALSPRIASAGEREEARRHFKAGMEDIGKGNYERGLAELKIAYDTLPHRNVLYNIARAYAEMGDLESAVASYRRYLAENPPDKDEVEAVTKSLETRLAKSKAAAAAAAAAAASPATTTGTPPPTEPQPRATEPRPSVGAATPGLGTSVAPGVVAAAEIGESKAENVYEETVVTASKGAQSPLDAPNSTYIVTEQDIRLSGLTQIPELLRRVPGLDFMQVTASDYNLSMRGFNGRLSNKLLVLVNGRSVFLDFLGTTFWDILSINVEDIERIEVVRGPGSALYGADAFSGVVNIITKAPGEGRGGVSGAVGGQRGAAASSYHGAAWVTGRAREWAYRVSAGFDQMPRWSREVGEGRNDLGFFTPNQNLGTQVAKADIRFTRRIDKEASVGIGTGFSQLYRDFYGIGPYADAAANGVQGDVTGFLTTKHVNFRAFWNWLSADAGVGVYYLGDPSYRARAAQNVVDGELEYVTALRHGVFEHDLHVGVGYRLKTIRWSYLDKALRTENHYALYAQDSIKIGEDFIVVASLRGDYAPYLSKVIPSPRGSVIYKRTKADAFRVSVSSAFRSPSYLESYLDFPVTTPSSGAEIPSQALKSDDPSYRTQPERVLSTEIGYQNQASDYYAFDIAAYYNRVSDIIVLDSTRQVSPSAVARGAGGYNEQTGRYAAAFGGFTNDCQIFHVYGGEVGVRAFPVTGLDLYGGYAYNYVNQVAPSGCAATVKDQRTSRHKITGGAQVRTQIGIDVSADVWFASSQVWAEQKANFVTRDLEYQQFALDAHPIVNARVGYRFKTEPLEIGVSSTNLFDKVHREHPFGQLIGRKVMAMASYRF